MLPPDLDHKLRNGILLDDPTLLHSVGPENFAKLDPRLQLYHLHNTAELGHRNALGVLLAWGADPNLANLVGNNALDVALAYGQPECAALCIQHGGKQTCGTPRAGYTAKGRKDHGEFLDLVAANEIEGVRALLGANPKLAGEAADNDDSTALHIAAYSGHVAMIELLIGAGADINATTWGVDQTPLDYARWGNKHAAAEIIIRHGGESF